MRVFVTGASGWIGSAVVLELLAAGHHVVGLARSEASAAALAKAGAEARRGSLDDLGVLRDAAAESDGVIHLAFKHELAFSGDFDAAADADRRAIETLGDALAGSGRPLLIAAGTLGIAPGRLATEEDGRASAPSDAGALDSGPSKRMDNARAALALADRGVSASVVRLPPTVHGDGDHGFLAAIVATARAKGSPATSVTAPTAGPPCTATTPRTFSASPWRAPAGSVLHAVADEGVPIRAVAEVIGRRLGLAVASVDPADAAAHFGWLAALLALDGPASGVRTRALLGWQPTRPGLLDDLDRGHYFAAPAA